MFIVVVVFKYIASLFGGLPGSCIMPGMASQVVVMSLSVKRSFFFCLSINCISPHVVPYIVLFRHYHFCLSPLPVCHCSVVLLTTRNAIYIISSHEQRNQDHFNLSCWDSSYLRCLNEKVWRETWSSTNIMFHFLKKLTINTLDFSSGWCEIMCGGQTLFILFFWAALAPPSRGTAARLPSR